MTTDKQRTTSLTTIQMHHLDEACRRITVAFRDCPYLVGSAYGADGSPRDVDVRLMLDDAAFAAACPTQEMWELLCVSIGVWLTERTGLPIDFQIQRTTEANAKYGDQPRNPLGMKRRFAGGGDAVPPWAAPLSTHG